MLLSITFVIYMVTHYPLNIPSRSQHRSNQPHIRKVPHLTCRPLQTRLNTSHLPKLLKPRFQPPLQLPLLSTHLLSSHHQPIRLRYSQRNRNCQQQLRRVRRSNWPLVLHQLAQRLEIRRHGRQRCAPEGRLLARSAGAAAAGALASSAGCFAVRARVVHCVELVEREGVHCAGVVWQGRGPWG